jgi:drug/metabolite transporter (DMT)-like permease
MHASLGPTDALLRAVHRHHHLSAHTTIAAVLALLSAMAFAVAMVSQQRAASEVSSDRPHRQLFMHLISSPQWLAATAGAGLGYLLQAVALGFGSVLVVQPLIVTSLLFALPLGARLDHRRLPASAWVWGIVLAGSLAVFVTAGNPNTGFSHAPRKDWLLVAIVVVPILAVCTVAARRSSGATRASLLAVVVGVLAGVLVVLTKAVVASIRIGVSHAVTSWELYALLIVGGTGVLMQQLSFQAGALQASLPVILVLEPLVAAGLGVALLHERMRASGLRADLLALSVLAMLLATVALARGRAHIEQR